MNKIINYILILICIFSLIKIGEKQWGYYQNESIYEEIRTTVKQIDQTKKDDITDSNLIYNTLKSINKDYKGWIKIEKTNIDYPVVQTSDNDYYLTHDFNQDNSSSGAIYLDYRNQMKDKHLIIYGHNMRNNTMFQNLEEFKKKEFFETSPQIVLTDEVGNHYYEVFSVYVKPASELEFKTSYTSDEVYKQFIKEIEKISLYNSSLVVTEEDTILTLSTCSYEFNNARTVVHAKLIK